MLLQITFVPDSSRLHFESGSIASVEFGKVISLRSLVPFMDSGENSDPGFSGELLSIVVMLLESSGESNNISGTSNSGTFRSSVPFCSSRWKAKK